MRDMKDKNNICGPISPSNHSFISSDQVNENTITRERGISTSLIKLLVTPYKRKIRYQASMMKEMRWLEPSGASISVVTMKNFISGNKIQRLFSDTRSY